MTDGCGHPADLPVSPFGESDFQPSGGDGFAEADGDGSWGESRVGRQQVHGCREHVPAVEGKRTVGQRVEGVLVWNPFHLSEVCAGVMVPGSEEAVIQQGAVGQQQKAFAVCVESSGGVDIVRKGSEGSQGRVTPRMKTFGELRENAEGLMEEKDSGGITLHGGMYDRKFDETTGPRCFFRGKSLFFA